MMQKELIIQKLREQGCRITRQREMLLDIILEEDCSCCKEIYYKASRRDKNIGAATVYRMVNTLEEIGAISRKNMYKVSCETDCGKACCEMAGSCQVELDDGSVLEFSEQKWNQIVQTGLDASGYTGGRQLRKVIHTEIS